MVQHKCFKRLIMLRNGTAQVVEKTDRITQAYNTTWRKCFAETDMGRLLQIQSTLGDLFPQMVHSKIFHEFRG